MTRTQVKVRMHIFDRHPHNKPHSSHGITDLHYLQPTQRKHDRHHSNMSEEILYLSV